MAPRPRRFAPYATIPRATSSSSPRTIRTPHPGLDPGSPLGKQIVKQWGSIDAYYLDYQNRRAAHLKELWKVVDWEIIQKRFIV
ncbi:MAG: hypothetical protein IJT74_04385 [Bacteroidales bacterium]|nr:hypothetical protein [Bacteroidales bacterium]